jgi:hypothetical protein
VKHKLQLYISLVGYRGYHKNPDKQRHQTHHQQFRTPLFITNFSTSNLKQQLAVLTTSNVNIISNTTFSFKQTVQVNHFYIQICSDKIMVSEKPIHP